MRQKNNNSKIIYQPTKKRKQKPINKSQKSSSEMNDDSLDMLQKNQFIKSRLKTNNNEDINEEDLNQLRTCISNQFKKSNFINFSMIKSKGNVIQLQPSKIDTNQNQNTNKESKTQTTTEQVPGQISKRNLLTCHNRSQSCPFIEPMYITQTMQTKDSRPQYPGIVFSSVKLDKQRKKISMEYLSKHKNRFNSINTGLNNQKKANINHNYSNSLTQSSNTVIVHNLPNDYQNNIITTSNLSNILYHKQQVQDQEQDQDDTKIIEQIDPKQIKDDSVIEKKSVVFKQKIQKIQILQSDTKISFYKPKQTNKKQTKSIDKKALFAIKAKIQQQMSQYEISQEKKQFQIYIQTFKKRQSIFNKLLKSYLGTKTKSQKQCSINSEKLISANQDKKISLKNIQKNLKK